MREIKFMTWDEERKKLIGPFEIGSKLSEMHKPDMEYIDKKDTNGIDIYTGHIVKASIYCDEKPQILEVYFSPEFTSYIIDYEDSDNDCVSVGSFAGTMEIIGNKYENPELLD